MRQWGEAFPAAYRADWVPRSALADIGHIELLAQDDDLAISLYRPLESPPHALRAKVFRSGAPLALSDLLPLFENMGVEVADERPYRIAPRQGEPFWIYDFGLTYAGENELEADQCGGLPGRVPPRLARRPRERRLQPPGPRARLTGREVSILRAVGRYLRQAGTTLSDTYVEQALVSRPAVARLLVDLFHARFEPGRADPRSLRTRAHRADDRRGGEPRPGSDPPHLPGSRAGDAPHELLPTRRGEPAKASRLVQTRPVGAALAPSAPSPVRDLRLLAAHRRGALRGGKVARGGIRWSDRREDFRTEVLGLMKAQMVKNAVIVPVGAKGGFVVKRPPDDREALQDEGEACYRIVISGLLDPTDNIADGEIVPPPDVVRYDGDDPYLVVAADKGTAALSDVANGIAHEYGFWLGDAFASGARPATTTRSWASPPAAPGSR